ncbi:MAG: P-II family nitrogen regulator [Dehalococcoidia bacterium]
MDEDVATMLNVVTTVARTREMADEKLFVLPIENAVPVRTGEENDNAI